MQTVVRVEGAWKTYRLGDHEVHALRGVSLEVTAGEFVALLGPSGCGKSTLLHILGAMDRPSRGTVELEGQDIATLSGGQQTALRLRRIGFVFQTFNLLPTLTALENVAFPMRLAGMNLRSRRERAQALLEQVGLADRGDHLPRQLSGGQRQRVAIARSLANDPALILADEPTGNLDTESGNAVLEILQRLHRSGKTIIMVTHNADMALHAGSVMHMRDGQLSEQTMAAD